jgi:hypothetical protein
MREQIDPGIPLDLAWRDGDVITVRIRTDGTSDLARCLLGAGGEIDDDEQIILPAANLTAIIKQVTTYEMDRRIAPHIPTARAWKAGRRIYVTSAYKSRLGDELYGIGAKWDRDEGARWVGSGKLNQVIPLIEAHEERVARTQAVKEAGLLVKIPFDAAGVREQAKELGARWDKEKKAWAMPDAESLGQVQVLVGEWQDADKLRKDEGKAARAADRAKRSRSAEEIIAESGRSVVPGGRQASFQAPLKGFVRRVEAAQYAPEPGEIRTVKGVHYLVLKGSVEFWNDDTVADLAPHYQEATWVQSWTGVPVEELADTEAAE